MNRSLLPFILLLCSIVLSAAAQLLMKAGMLEYKNLLHDAPLANISHAVEFVSLQPGLLIWIIAGFICYGLSMLAWLMALTRYAISYAYPMLGLSYVLVYLGAVYWDRIGEAVTLERSFGIILVLVGVALVNIKGNSCTQAGETDAATQRRI